MADESTDDVSPDDAIAQIDELIADDQLDAARQRLDDAVERLGRRDSLRVLEAEIMLESGDYDRCLSVVDAALAEVDQDQPRAQLLALKGYAAYYLDEVDQARQAFNRAVQADPDAWTAIVGRAMVHDYLGFYQAAKIDLDRAIALDDQEGQPFAIRGLIEIRFGQLDDARRDLGYAVDSDPWDEESRLNLARLQALDGQSAAARETLEVLVDDGVDPEFVVPGALLRSQLALGLGSADAAAADADAATDQSPDQPWGYLALAAARITGGRPGEAIAALKDAEARIDEPRDFPDLFALRASAYDQLGKPDKAQRAHQSAEGASRLPEFVYGQWLNPSQNVPVNPDNPVDVRSIMRQIFGDPDEAPPGYEDAVRQVLDRIPDYVEENPDLGQIEVELPRAEGMDESPGNLVIELNGNQ